MKAPDKTNEELCVLAQQGDADAADRLVRQCLPFIRQQASRLWLRMGLEGKTAVMDQEDLVQEGCIGLLNAIPIFDHTLEMKFLTFAGKLIYLYHYFGGFSIIIAQNNSAYHNRHLAIADRH